MDKIKPAEKISHRFQISLESAKYLLGRVQKSFKTEKPSHKLIAEFIKRPFRMATYMYHEG